MQEKLKNREFVMYLVLLKLMLYNQPYCFPCKGSSSNLCTTGFACNTPMAGGWKLDGPLQLNYSMTPCPSGYLGSTVVHSVRPLCSGFLSIDRSSSNTGLPGPHYG